MFELSELKQTKVYQEAFQEGKEEGKEEGERKGERKGKLKVVAALLAAGLTVEQIAEALDLSVEDVRQATQKPDNDE